MLSSNIGVTQEAALGISANVFFMRIPISQYNWCQPARDLARRGLGGYLCPYQTRRTNLPLLASDTCQSDRQQTRLTVLTTCRQNRASHPDEAIALAFPWRRDTLK